MSRKVRDKNHLPKLRINLIIILRELGEKGGTSEELSRIIGSLSTHAQASELLHMKGYGIVYYIVERVNQSTLLNPGSRRFRWFIVDKRYVYKPDLLPF